MIPTSRWFVVGGEGLLKLVRDLKRMIPLMISLLLIGETDSTFSFNFKVENIKILSRNI